MSSCRTPRNSVRNKKFERKCNLLYRLLRANLYYCLLSARILVMPLGLCHINGADEQYCSMQGMCRAGELLRLLTMAGEISGFLLVIMIGGINCSTLTMLACVQVPKFDVQFHRPHGIMTLFSCIWVILVTIPTRLHWSGYA